MLGPQALLRASARGGPQRLSQAVKLLRQAVSAAAAAGSLGGGAILLLCHRRLLRESYIKDHVWSWRAGAMHAVAGKAK
jgi:hypothetical protein